MTEFTTNDSKNINTHAIQRSQIYHKNMIITRYTTII